MTSLDKQTANPFPYDIWTKIIGLLPAPDIIRCKFVCRQFLEASRERSTWIQAFWEAGHPIPDVNPRTIYIPRLEKILVSLSRINDVWSHPSRHELTLEAPSKDYNKSLIRLDPLRGNEEFSPFIPCWFMAPYVITLSTRRNILEYFLEDKTEPFFYHDLPIYRQELAGVRGNIDAQNMHIFNLAYISSGESRLEVISVKYDEETQRFDTENHVHYLHEIPLHEKFVIYAVQYDYVILSIKRQPNDYYLVIHITSGKQISFCVIPDTPVWHDAWLEYTPHHIIVIRNAKHTIERECVFYEWPTTIRDSESTLTTSHTRIINTQNERTLARPKHTMLLLRQYHICTILPRSLSSYAMIITRKFDSYGFNLQILVIDILDQGSEEPVIIGEDYKSISFKWNPGWGVNEKIHGLFNGLSPDTNSFLGIVQAYSYQGYDLTYIPPSPRALPRPTSVFLLLKIEGLRGLSSSSCLSSFEEYGNQNTGTLGLKFELKEFRIPSKTFLSCNMGLTTGHLGIGAVDLFSGRMLLYTEGFRVERTAFVVKFNKRSLSSS